MTGVVYRAHGRCSTTFLIYWGRRFRYQLAILSIAAIVVSCSACDSRDARTIAVVPQTTGAELWEAVHAGAERAGRETGFHIYWNGPTSEDDVEKQISFIQRVFRNENAGLVLAPDQYLTLVAPVREVLNKHIPVVVIRSSLSIPAGDGLFYILNDEETTGRLAADQIGKSLQGKGAVAIVGIQPDVAGTVLRVHAFAAYLAAKFPDIKIIARRTGSPNPAETQRTTAEVLANHQKIDGILALTAPATQGALASLRMLGKVGSVKLVGCDQELELMAAVRRGEIDAIIAENTYEMGYRAVRLISERREQQSTTSEIRLQPVLVNRENIDLPPIQKILSSNWRINP